MEIKNKNILNLEKNIEIIEEKNKIIISELKVLKESQKIDLNLVNKLTQFEDKNISLIYEIKETNVIIDELNKNLKEITQKLENEK